MFPAACPVLSNQNSLFDKDAFKKSAQHSNATHFLICIQCFECPQVFVRKYAHSIYNSIDSKKNVYFFVIKLHMPKIESLYGQVFILPPYIFPRILLFESCFQYNSIIFELFVYPLKYLNTAKIQ